MKEGMYQAYMRRVIKQGDILLAGVREKSIEFIIWKKIFTYLIVLVYNSKCGFG